MVYGLHLSYSYTNTSPQYLSHLIFHSTLLLYMLKKKKSAPFTYSRSQESADIVPKMRNTNTHGPSKGLIQEKLIRQLFPLKKVYEKKYLSVENSRKIKYYLTTRNTERDVI